MLELLDEGHCGKELTIILGVSKAVISKRIAALEKQNLISSFGGSPKFYKLTQTGKVNLMSLRVRKPNPPKTSTADYRRKLKGASEEKVKKTTQTSYILDTFMDIHDYKVIFKIVEHGHIPAELGVTKKVKNWEKRFFTFNKPIKLKFELTTQSILVYATGLKMQMNEPYSQFMARTHAQILIKVSEFAKKYGYVIDLQSPKVISQHYATRVNKEIDKKIPKGTIHTLRLGRPAESMTGQMKEEAKVWGERSRNLWELETNDMHYAKLMQEVPLRVKNIDDNVTELKSAMKELGQFHDAISLYTKQINLHLEAVNNINQNQIKFNTSLDKFTSILERLEKKIK